VTNVLIVEDDPDIREALAEFLQFEGFGVRTAGDGGAALVQLRTNGQPLPSIILLDLKMPGMNGQQFREAQLKDPKLSSIPVVVLTADGDADRKAAAIEASGFIKKPVHLDELLSMIRDHARN
jgi:DNA-binding response OmpR family regulator